MLLQGHPCRKLYNSIGILAAAGALNLEHLLEVIILTNMPRLLYYVTKVTYVWVEFNVRLVHYPPLVSED